MAKRKPEAEKVAPPPFEKSLERLEEIAQRLEEEEEMSLEESLRLFEEGVVLSRQCGQRLSAAEQKVEALTRQADGTLAAEPFDPEDAEE